MKKKEIKYIIKETKKYIKTKEGKEFLMKYAGGVLFIMAIGQLIENISYLLNFKTIYHIMQLIH